MNWAPYVSVRYAICLSLGILLGIYFPTTNSVIGFVLPALAIIYFFILVLFPFKKIRTVTGCFGLAFLVLTGYFLVEVKTESNNPNHIIHQDSISFYRVTITAPLKKSERTWKTEGKVAAVRIGTKWISSSGRVLLYIRKNEEFAPYKYGDELLVRGAPQLVSGPMNPNAFDYREFLSYKNIFHQDFVSSDKVAFIGNRSLNKVYGAALSIRQWALQIIHQHVTGAQEQAIVSALVLGVTDELDNDILDAYAASGAMHVLAVSGLHVGIIYWIIIFVLRPLKYSRWGKWAIALLAICILWSYAMITGLSPSVLRAVTMLSFMAFSVPMQRRTNIYNTLGVTACCLLIYNPFLIMSVGFQLSFLAVLGILYLFPRIYFLWTPTSRILDSIWKVTSVSLSAQLATFSLGLLYFHQFPVYFLISNLFVIPGAFIIVVGGLLLIITSFVPLVASILGYILTLIVKTLNILVFTIESLPFSKIDQVYITSVQCWCLLIAISLMLALIEFRKINYLYAAVVAIILFSTTQWIGYLAGQKETRITVYSINGHTAIDLKANGEVFFLADSLLKGKDDIVHFHLNSSRLAGYVNSVTIADTLPFVKNFNGCRLILWYNKRVLLIFERDFTFVHDFPLDMVVVSNDVIRKLDDLKGRLDFETLVVDGSNSFYVAERLRRESAKSDFNFHSVRHQGFFEEIIE